MPNGRMISVKRSVKTVSYTHLDVYKRQVYIFEFKLDGTAAEALQQIEDKG